MIERQQQSQLHLLCVLTCRDHKVHQQVDERVLQRLNPHEDAEHAGPGGLGGRSRGAGGGRLQQAADLESVAHKQVQASEQRRHCLWIREDLVSQRRLCVLCGRPIQSILRNTAAQTQ